MVAEHLAQILDPDQGQTFDGVGHRIDVTWKSEIKCEEWSTTADDLGSLELGSVHDIAGCAGARDDDVGLGQGSVEGIKSVSLAVDGAGHPSSVRMSSVRYDDPPDPRTPQRRRGEGAHRACPDDECRLPVESAERLARKIQTNRNQGCAGSVDSRLGVRALAYPERLLHEVVEHSAGRSGLLRVPERAPDLRED